MIDIAKILKEAERLADGVAQPYRPAAFEFAARVLREGSASRGSDAAAQTEQPQPTKQARTSKSGVRTRTSRSGPKKSARQLIDDGYFKSARTLSDVQKQLSDKKGLSYTAQELSPSLVRLVRDGVLERSRNASGTFEYLAKT